jgi:membrane protease YdiL (CAAX protease family)
MDVKERPLSQQKGEVKYRFSPFIAYLLLFYGCWIGWVYLIYPPTQALGTATLAYALANIATRLLLWIIPVFLYLRYIDHVNPVAYLKLNQYWKRGILLGLALTLLNFLGTMLRFGPPHPSLHYVTWNSILGTSILIGFFEEIPFRGFIFQKLQEKFPVWIANLLSSLLFLCIHLPGWIMLHTLTWSNVISIFVLGVIFAAIFYFSKTLWSSIVTHSLNDFLSFVLFHLS